jgi:hypothetical protein
MLANHPEITASRVKETNFFINRFRDATNGNEYGECFPSGEGAAKIKMESSPLYFAFGRPLAEKIRATLRDTKIIVTLREPVARFLSVAEHIKVKRNIGSNLDFDSVVREAVNGAQLGGVSLATVNDYVVREGEYRRVIAEWLSVFGEENVRVVYYEDLFENEERLNVVMGSLLGWLGIDSGLRIPFMRENVGREVWSGRLHSIALAVNDYLEPLLNRFQFMRDWLRAVYYRFNEKKGGRGVEYISEEAREILVAHYLRVNSGLSAMVTGVAIGRSPDWIK